MWTIQRCTWKTKYHGDADYNAVDLKILDAVKLRRGKDTRTERFKLTCEDDDVESWADEENNSADGVDRVVKIFVNESDHGDWNSRQDAQPVEEFAHIFVKDAIEASVEGSHITEENEVRIEGDLQHKDAVVHVILQNVADHWEVRDWTSDVFNGSTANEEIEEESRSDEDVSVHGHWFQRNGDQRSEGCLANYPGRHLETCMRWPG